ncbi:MAG: hypothetical protein FJ164_11045 [Gammaproteobacteria bacterium]|nr:hypothetical protein [Gammaproteobacteria bacterium]
MWNKPVGVLMVGMLLSLPIGQQVVRGDDSTASSDARVSTLATQVQSIMNEGDAGDVVPVIVTLKNPYGIESAIQPRSSITFRRAQIRTIQNGFVGRQGVRIVSVKRRSKVFPIVYMSMVRGNVAQLAADSQVEMVAIDRPVPPSMFASTELIGSRIANDSGYDGTGTSVAVLDTGVLATHPFLSGQVVGDACFSTTDGFGSTSFCPGGAGTSTAVGSGGPCPSDVDGCDHGTHVAGTVAGNVISVSTPHDDGTQTIRGVAPGAKIIAVQVFSRFPVAMCGEGATSECALSYTSDVDAALEWLYDTVVAGTESDWGDLASINMSLGGGEYAEACDEESTKFYVDQLRTIDVATVIASGNDSSSVGISSPACISSAIAVGATTSTYGLAAAADQVAVFSNSPLPENNTANGNGDRLLDLLAPGHWVYSGLAHPGTTYDYFPGTSMATPHVAGAWAVMKQAAPTASVAQVLEWLYSTGTSITDSGNGLVLPRINVDDAVIQPLLPATFDKSSPAHNRINQPFTLTLSWAASSRATSYEYCLARSANSCTTWESVGTAKSVTVRNLARNRAYFWDVRAKNSSGTIVANDGVWKFTTTNSPVTFNKSGPANNLVNRPFTITLSWAASSGAASYEYCFATTAAQCTNWKSVGTAKSVTVRNLARNRAYFWDVRAKNSSGATVANGGVWKFTTAR